MKWPVAHSPNSTWFWLELVGNCCERLKIIMKCTKIQFCERLGYGWQFHPLRAPDRVLFTLHPRLGSEVIRRHMAILAALSMCTAQPRMNSDVRFRGNRYTSDELGHGRPRQKSWTRTRISVNTKHQFTCFDCVPARTRMLGPRSQM